MKVEIAKVEVAKESATPSVVPVVEPAKEIVASTTSSTPVAKKIVTALEKPVEKATDTPKKTEEVQVAIAKVQEETVAQPVAMKPETPSVAAEKVAPKKLGVSKVIEKTVADVAKITPASVQPQVQAPAKEMKTATQPAPEVKKGVIVANAASIKTPARRVLRTGSSVIIRRGDSLWRISYRTYGRGIRYSTIYQANLSQLRSPHRIYPGQILKVPKTKFKQQG